MEKSRTNHEGKVEFCLGQLGIYQGLSNVDSRIGTISRELLSLDLNLWYLVLIKHPIKAYLLVGNISQEPKMICVALCICKGVCW